MKYITVPRSHSSQILLLVGLLILIVSVTSTENQNSEILVRRFSHSNSSSGIVPKILKVSKNGHEEIVQVPEIVNGPLFSLKSDPVKVQTDFKTVDVSVLNRQRDKENAKKVAIIQEDLQSRIKINEPDTKTKFIEEITEPIFIDPKELMNKQVRVKEDLESRLLFDYRLLGHRKDNERQEKFHNPVKRSDDDYYADEFESSQQSRMTTEKAKEEDSFFSIFESLFGSGDDESQTKKKSKPEEDPMFKDSEEASMKENIKTVSDILKPLKPSDEPESKTQNAFSGYHSDVPEYRIVNNFQGSQSHIQEFKPPESKPSYHNFYKATEKPFRPYKPHTTNGYEDYDLDEFLEKAESTTIRMKTISPIVTTSSIIRSDPTTTPFTLTTTSAKTTTKNIYDNKLKFPSIQKKNDYINRNRYQEIKTDVTEKKPELMTERITYQKPEIKTTTTEIHYYTKPNYETKINEIKPQKIQESPNFYNLINLPVRYSTKDTAIPLISTSYANTKIQGMGAHKYEKGSNGKYANHKYDQATMSTTKRPHYWATKRTSTDKTSMSFEPSLLIPKTTTQNIILDDLDKMEYNDMAIGTGHEFGGYGSKTVEIKTQPSTRKTTTTVLYKETTTRKNDEVKLKAEESQHVPGFRPNSEQGNVIIKEIEKIPEKTSLKPAKVEYEDYEYDSFPKKVQQVNLSVINQNYSPQINLADSEKYLQKNDLENKTQQQLNSYKTSSVMSVTESQKLPEIAEYEYYDYEDLTTTTTTTSTIPKYKIKYPNLPKEKIKISSNEKVAVVVPSKNHDFLENQSNNIKMSTIIESGSTTMIPTTMTTASVPKSSSTTVRVTQTATSDISNKFKKITTQFYKPNHFYKEPAPVFEDVKEQEDLIKDTSTSTKTAVSGKRTTTESSIKPVIITSTSKDSENNINIVLVPTKETIKNVEVEEKYLQPESSSLGPVHKTQNRPATANPSNYDYSTEFTVGVVHGTNEARPQTQENFSFQAGHFVGSSISTIPFGNDEPFRPISKPPGMTSNFQMVHEEVQRIPLKNLSNFQSKHPISTPPSLEESEPIHEPHEFIPSPQFHRPVEQKRTSEIRPGAEVDYDFEGIQTEPKPGQYVIFSKPQLNPEMNENQLKKKPEINSPTKVISNVPHYHEKVNHFDQENQKLISFKESQIYQNAGKQSASDKMEQSRPIFGGLPEINDERLLMQLVPPRGTQTEKPFEGNFALPQIEKQESTISYPRPHWEKNGKPSFLLNNLSNKNELLGGRHPSPPPQMAPTLIPPSSIPPQRFRRPLPPHMPPMRKNFNEAGTNVKPKPNLPNILPQFRPNAKVGNGPYHRPPSYIHSNRRNGVNRHHEKEHGNFPYHIQHPEKDALMHREYDMGPEIVPKFINNRGKLPSDLWNSQGMQKRFGQGPMNINSKIEDFIISNQSPDQKILKRLQRTPVTTLQMLKQIPGVKTQKAQVNREDSAEPLASLVPPIYKTFTDQPKNEENLYIVYPAKAPQKLQPDNTKVFIVSDTKSQKKFYNLTNLENQHPVLNLNKRGNFLVDKSKNDFPYGFIKPDERLKSNKKKQNEKEEKNFTDNDTRNDQINAQKYKILPASNEKVDKIDMNLHMQSNNQWNELKTPFDSVVLDRNPSDKYIEKIRSDHYRFSDEVVTGLQKQSELTGTRIDPPSEYKTSIKDENNSAFTLGAVMHTMSETLKKGQVTSASLHNDNKEISLPKLNVNEKISNGKIITVSMPLDVKQDSNNKENSEKYHFQAPFQASSSVTTSESHSTNQGWSIVKNSDEISNSENGKETTETSTNNHFNFENFKPELIGGFKPIYELPENLEESKEQEKNTDRKEKMLYTR